MADKSGKNSRGKDAKDAGKSQAKGRGIAAEDLPRRTLEECLKLAEALHNIHADQATWAQLAQDLNVGAASNNTKYLFWSATAYGVINKDETDGGTGTDQAFTLSEVGRKILAPTYEGERREGVIRALMTPKILSSFYTLYNNKPLPGGQYLANVLSQKYAIPPDRVEEATRIIIENARYGGFLVENGTEQRIRLEASGQTSLVPPIKEDGTPSQAQGASVQGAPAAAGEEDWSKTCFVITPIGADGSEERKHADMMLKHLLEPAMKEHGIKVVRADKIAQQGIITQQVFEYLARARLCVSDLSFNNPNAFYELGVRHMFRLPNIQIIRNGDKIPFDVAQGRTIIIDTADRYSIMDRFESARRELSEHIKHFMQSTSVIDEGSPVSVYLPGVEVKWSK